MNGKRAKALRRFVRAATPPGRVARAYAPHRENEIVRVPVGPIGLGQTALRVIRGTPKRLEPQCGRALYQRLKGAM